MCVLGGEGGVPACARCVLCRSSQHQLRTCTRAHKPIPLSIHHQNQNHAPHQQAFSGGGIGGGGGGEHGGLELNEDVERVTRWWIQVGRIAFGLLWGTRFLS